MHVAVGRKGVAELDANFDEKNVGNAWLCLRKVVVSMKVLESIDRLILLFINGHHTLWLDNAMWFLTQTLTWAPFYLMLVWLLFVCKGRKMWKWLLLIALTVACADLVSSGVIKPLVARPRPTHTLGVMEHLHLHRFPNGTFYRGGAYGFVSSHAANSSAIALLVWLTLRKEVAQRNLLAVLLVSYVLVFCYTRMYLGVHFPSDILGGLCVGVVCAIAGYDSVMRRFHIGELSITHN